MVVAVFIVATKFRGKLKRIGLDVKAGLSDSLEGMVRTGDFMSSVT
jgi:hypothetical protein